MDTSELALRYKSFLSEKLVEIIDHPEGYLPEAIELAKEEISSRNIGEEEMKRIRIFNNQKRYEDAGSLNNIQKTSEEIIGSFLQKLKRLLTADEIKKPKTIILLLLVLNSIIFLYNFIFSTLPFLITYGGGPGTWDSYMLLILLGELYLPICLVFMFLRFKSGWYLFSYNFSLSALSSLILILYNYFYFSSYENDNSLGELLNAMDPQRPYLQLYLNFLYNGAMATVINLNVIRNYFNVSNTGKWICFALVGLTALFSILYGYLSQY